MYACVQDRVLRGGFFFGKLKNEIKREMTQQVIDRESKTVSQHRLKGEVKEGYGKKWSGGRRGWIEAKKKM